MRLLPLRLGVIIAMAWIAFVLWRYADPSVTGVYVVFYLIMGYAVVKVFGQFAPSWFGAQIRVDAGGFGTHVPEPSSGSSG